MTIDLREAAILEVRNEASAEQVKALNENPVGWRDGLQSVVDEMEAQLTMRLEKFRDDTEWMSEGSGEWQEKFEEYNNWKKKGRTFRKHIEARLATVRRLCPEVSAQEFAEAVRAVYAADMEADQLEDDEMRFDDAVEALYSLLRKYDGQD
jgi:hypothetical protein